MKVSSYHLLLVVAPCAVGAEQHIADSSRLLSSICQNDGDCTPEEQYCASGRCIAVSTCYVEVDCYNPSNDHASCVGGFFECQEEQCICMMEQPCPNGRVPVNCFVAPCEVNPCDGAISCVDNYCGGCNSIRFDSAGYQVCNVNGNDYLRTTCQSHDDCSLSDQYCAQGVCLGFGSCTSSLDCFNPSNTYDTDQCEKGYLECQHGVCGIICDGFQCQDGSNFVPCAAQPCSVDACEDRVVCVDDYCGGCNAIHFDGSGNQVCNGDDPTGGVPTPCQSDEDCSLTQVERELSMEYCAQGICLEQGSCTTDLDCINPSNSYPVDACEGYLECQDGHCGIVCEEPCRDGRGFSENCVVQPCSVETCDNAVSCVDDYCGGCHSIHFDATGLEVCKRICQSTQDCENEQYCASGECLDFSTCHDDVDCLNPYNRFAVPECEGYLECKGDICNKMCAESLCCYSETCTPDIVAQCDEGVSCIMDNCGGDCGEIHYDAAGNQVCKQDDQEEVRDVAFVFSMACVWCLSLAFILLL